MRTGKVFLVVILTSDLFIIGSLCCMRLRYNNGREA